MALIEYRLDGTVQSRKRNKTHTISELIGRAVVCML